jgi:hypothetical protein
MKPFGLGLPDKEPSPEKLRELRSALVGLGEVFAAAAA